MNTKIQKNIFQKSLFFGFVFVVLFFVIGEARADDYFECTPESGEETLRVVCTIHSDKGVNSARWNLFLGGGGTPLELNSFNHWNTFNLTKGQWRVQVKKVIFKDGTFVDELPGEVVIDVAESSAEELKSNFTVFPNNENVPFTADFQDISTGDIVKREWNWGDGSPKAVDPGLNVSHEYTVAGLYEASLTVFDADGNSDIRTVPINAIDPGGGGTNATANFSADPITGVAPLGVTFTDTSTGSVQSLKWDFGEDYSEKSGTIGGTEVYEYLDPGSYTVTLTATGTDGKDNTKSVTITVTDPGSTNATANFSADPITGVAPLGVTFTDTSTGAVQSLKWDFGEDYSEKSGTIGGTEIYEYLDPGTYNVTLTTTGTDGKESKKNTVITVTDPNDPDPDPDPDPKSGDKCEDKGGTCRKFGEFDTPKCESGETRNDGFSCEQDPSGYFVSICCMPESSGSGGSGGVTVSYSYTNPLKVNSFTAWFMDFLATLQSIIGWLAVIMIVVGGIVYITSGGIQSQVTLGKTIITYALIGFAFVVAVPSILKEVIKVFKAGYGASGDVIESAKPLGLILTDILNFILIGVGILAMIAFVVGGMMYIFAAGDHGRQSAASKIITYAIIAVLVSGSALIIIKQIIFWLQWGA